jgi:DNA integrity scanning protein DisA with diadenylate cyclase activity
MKFKSLLFGFALMFLTTSNVLLSQGRSALLEQLSLAGQKISTKAQEMHDIEQGLMTIIAEYMKSKSTDEKQLLEIAHAIDERTAQFKKELAQAFSNKQMIGFLSQKLFSDKPYKGFEIDIVKLGLIRLLVEYRILRDLVAEYEQLAQQLAKIDATALND